MSRVVAVVQARMGSSRLPGKVMADIEGKPMLQRVLERARAAKRVDQVVIATSTHAQDWPILSLADRLGYRAIAGSEHDVLSRYAEAARASYADVVVRITSDCPLLDPALMGKTIALFEQSGADYAANCCMPYSFPRGVEAEVFSAEKLLLIDKVATQPYEREHVTPYFYQHPGQFRLEALVAEGELRRPDIRLCVDTAEDLSLVRKIYAHFALRPQPFALTDVVAFLDARPDLRTLNEHVHQKALGE